MAQPFYIENFPGLKHCTVRNYLVKKDMHARAVYKLYETYNLNHLYINYIYFKNCIHDK